MNRFESLRTMVDRFLVDTCTIREPGAVTFDPELGYDTTTAGDEVYAGVGRLRPTGGERVVIAGDAPITLHLYDLTVPYDTVGLKVNQLATIDTSDDPMLEGRIYRIVDVQGGSDGAYRRLIVEDTVDVGEGS